MGTHSLGSEARPLRVAVVGSGPSAFYAADALFKTDGLSVLVDMFDRLPTPFGLVRGGVAPDHAKIKTVVKGYEKTASHAGFRFFGNVTLGRDIQVEDLTAHYDQIIYAVGNESDRAAGIPGEDLKGVHSATEFVGWYNGHPDFSSCAFDLKGAKRVAVIGNGNVAMDVTRVLVQSPDKLASTDISDAALEGLRESSVEEVVLLGRRGPAQAAFSPKEIKELSTVEGVALIVPKEWAELDPVSAAWLEADAPPTARKNLEFLCAQAELDPVDAPRRVRVMFQVSPTELFGEDGKVTRLRVEHSELEMDRRGTPRAVGTGRFTDLDVDLVFKAIGYRGVKIEGVPFHDAWGIIPNAAGRVLMAADSDQVVQGQYVVGWAKRGPTGLIGTNNADSKLTVQAMIEDLAQLDRPAAAAEASDSIPMLLAARNIDFVSYEDWTRLDAWELQEGTKRGKGRYKLTSIADMMQRIRELRGS